MAAHLHWPHLHIPAPPPASVAKSAYRSLFCRNTSPMASSYGTVSLMMKTRRQDLDQRTRSGRRLVAAVSGGKVSLWLRSTCISQSQAAFRGPESKGAGLVRRFSPSWMKVIFRAKVVWAFRGKALVVTLLFPSPAAKHLSTIYSCLSVKG